MSVGEIWEGPLGSRVVRWRVTWVGTRKARLSAELDFGWAHATVVLARVAESLDWHRIEASA